MTRPTRKAAADINYAEQPDAKRSRTSSKMGCGASVDMKTAPVKSKAGKASSKNGGMARGDSAVDLSSFKGDFEPTKLAGKASGAPNTLEYRVNFTHKSKKISPWHDIPFKASKDTYHMMCEIPKWTRAKFEVATKEPNNPIKQDEKKGVLRDYKHGDMLFNYGFMPQTWEHPGHVCKDTGYKGDDDPLDMVEVGCRQMQSGQVAEVKVVGCLAMIDDGETDWKVFCIRVDDPLAPLIDDVEDLNRELPGAVDTMREWFRTYKLAEGKPLNAFALDEKCMARSYTQKVIEETHGMWRDSEQELRKLAAPKSPLTPAL